MIACFSHLWILTCTQIHKPIVYMGHGSRGETGGRRELTSLEMEGEEGAQGEHGDY